MIFCTVLSFEKLRVCSVSRAFAGFAATTPKQIMHWFSCLTITITWGLLWIFTGFFCEQALSRMKVIPVIPNKPLGRKVRNFSVWITTDFCIRLALVFVGGVFAPPNPPFFAAFVFCLVTLFSSFFTMHVVHFLQHTKKTLRRWHIVHHEWAEEETATDVWQAFHEHPVDLVLEIIATFVAVLPFQLLVSNVPLVADVYIDLTFPAHGHIGHRHVHLSAVRWLSRWTWTISMLGWSIGMRTFFTMVSHARVYQWHHIGVHQFHPQKNISELWLLDKITGTAFDHTKGRFQARGIIPPLEEHL